MYPNNTETDVDYMDHDIKNAPNSENLHLVTQDKLNYLV
jgi:hypothetical protein